MGEYVVQTAVMFKLSCTHEESFSVCSDAHDKENERKADGYDAEKADDAYCEQLLKEYQNDPDPHKTDAIPLEQLAQELGVAL